MLYNQYHKRDAVQMVEHAVRDREVAGSSPTIPTHFVLRAFLPLFIYTIHYEY